MINHVRTLLLNATPNIDLNFPGEEFVPQVFVPLTDVPNTSKKVRTVVFGGQPDRHMLNFRLQQLMGLLHTTELDEDVRLFDSRITYWPRRGDSFFRDVYGTTVTPLSGTSGSLLPVGELTAGDDVGQMRFYWKVEVVTSALVQVTNLLSTKAVDQLAYTVSGGRSSLLTFPGTALRFTVPGVVGEAWLVESIGRPQRNMGAILATLKASITDEDEVDLFGAFPVEPLKSYRNLWRDHPSLGYQLGGLLLGTATELNSFLVTRPAVVSAFDPSQLLELSFDIDTSLLQTGMNTRFFSGNATSPPVADDYFHTPSNTTHAGNDINMIVGCWVRFNNMNNVQHFITFGAGNLGRDVYRLRIDDSVSTSPVLQFIVTNNGSTQTRIAARFTPKYGKWYFVLGYHDAASDKIGIRVSKNIDYSDSTGFSLGMFDVGALSARFVLGGSARLIGGGTITAPVEQLNGNLSKVFTCKPTLSISAVLDDLEEALWNNGGGITWDELAATVPAGIRTQWGFTAGNGSYYDLTEESGVAVDSIGGINLTENGSVPGSDAGAGTVVNNELASSVTDVLRNITLSQATRTKQPTWILNSPINSQPAIRCDGTDDILIASAAANPYTSTQGLIALVFQLTVTPSSPATLFQMSDNTSDTAYFGVYLDTLRRLHLVVRGTVHNDVQFRDIVAPLNQTMIVVINSDGTKYTAHAHNLTQESVKIVQSGADTGAWTNSVPNRNSISLGASLRLAGEAEHFDGHIAKILLTNKANTANVSRLIGYLKGVYL
jgi:hypothetical protein